MYVNVWAVCCRSLYTFVKQSSYDDCSNRKNFLQHVTATFSRFRDLSGHEAFSSTSCHADAAAACRNLCTSLDLVLSTDCMLPWFDALLKTDLQRQAQLLQSEVERNSERGAGWALQREHALPVLECRQSLPAMVQGLSQAGMCGSHVAQYDVVLQWVGALWSSYFLYPLQLLFGNQSDGTAITLTHLQGLESKLRVCEASRELRSCADTLAQLDTELAQEALESHVRFLCPSLPSCCPA